MIIRTVGGFHYVVAQPEHARQAAVLAASLRPEFLGPAEHQLPIIRGVAAHDMGWTAYEANPRLADDGMPLNFTAMNRCDHLEIWRRTIFTVLEEIGPAAAAFLVRHAVTITTHDDPAEMKPDYDFGSMLEALKTRAWPGETPERATFFVERGFAALSFTDALSVTALVGWEDKLTLPLLREDGTRTEFTFWREGDWNVRVKPWPFFADELKNIYADAAVVPVGSERDAAQMLRHPRHHFIRRPIDYLPG